MRYYSGNSEEREGGAASEIGANHRGRPLRQEVGEPGAQGGRKEGVGHGMRGSNGGGGRIRRGGRNSCQVETVGQS